MAESDRIRWDRRHTHLRGIAPAPPGWLKEFDSILPRKGPALDIAAGTGRLALWLAGRGLDVLAVDISPVGLELVSHAATERRLQIETLAADLEVDRLPPGPFDVITCFNYRQRHLFPQIRDRLKEGGFLLAEVATVPNLKRHDHPSLQYLAEPMELQRDCAPLEIVFYQEGWFEDRASARVVARK